MSALTVTLGADITELKRGMAAAAQLVAASARRMSAIGASGLVDVRMDAAAPAQSGGFRVEGATMKASNATALTGGVTAAGPEVKVVTAAAHFQQTKIAFTTLIGDAAKAEATLARPHDPSRALPILPGPSPKHVFYQISNPIRPHSRNPRNQALPVN